MSDKRRNIKQAKRTNQPNPNSARARAAEEAKLAEEQRKRRNRIIAIVAALVLVFGAALGYQYWRTTRAPEAAGGKDGLAPITLSQSKPAVLGKAGAPERVRIYFDYHCSHCYDFEVKHGEALKQIQGSGKASVAYYPMSFIDAGSVSAANAFACAAEQGYASAYHDGLFANHTLQWSDRQLISLGEQVMGGPNNDFSACVTSKKNAAWVTSIATQAQTDGVNETPTLFIDGKVVDWGTLSAADFVAKATS